jgi:hypothetical protein
MTHYNVYIRNKNNLIIPTLKEKRATLTIKNVKYKKHKCLCISSECETVPLSVYWTCIGEYKKQAEYYVTWLSVKS